MFFGQRLKFLLEKEKVLCAFCVTLIDVDVPVKGFMDIQTWVLGGVS
jgi:hypothetical protein